MTIQELYDWAVEHNALNMDLRVCDYDGCWTTSIEPEIQKSKFGNEYVEL